LEVVARQFCSVFGLVPVLGLPRRKILSERFCAKVTSLSAWPVPLLSGTRLLAIGPAEFHHGLLAVNGEILADQDWGDALPQGTKILTVSNCCNYTSEITSAKDTILLLGPGTHPRRVE
jgi:hypothetical protein